MKMKKILDLGDLAIVAQTQSDDNVALDAMVEGSNRFETAYRLTTALDGLLTGSALEYSDLDSMIEEHQTDKDTFLDMLDSVFDIDSETLDSLKESKGDDFTDTLDVISETILDEFNEDIAPLAVYTYMDNYAYSNNNKRVKKCKATDGYKCQDGYTTQERFGGSKEKAIPVQWKYPKVRKPQKTKKTHKEDKNKKERLSVIAEARGEGKSKSSKKRNKD